MIAMIFEVWPKSEHRQDYLDTAAVLRPLLDGIEGFITRAKAPVKKPISAPNSVK
jgi:heme-degrading monooxygenase HmoA